MSCGSFKTKRFGKTSSGKQRWQCNKCKRTFVFSNPVNKRLRQKHWFQLWLGEGYNVRHLCCQSKHSRESLRRIITYWLDRGPDLNQMPDCGGSKYIIIDGTYIYKRLIQVMAVLDGQTNALIKGEYDIKENSLPQVTAMLLGLKQRSLEPKSATVDGNPQVIKALKLLWPGIIIQRCLVHVQRQGLMWCRRNPKSAAGKELRKLFLKVSNIHTWVEQSLFLSETKDWEQRFGYSIASAPERGYVISDIKRARSMLLNALPNMFHYLNNPNIPPTSNALEGYFSRMKKKYGLHCGLSPKRRRSYFNWYFHSCFK